MSFHSMLKHVFRVPWCLIWMHLWSNWDKLDMNEREFNGRRGWPIWPFHCVSPSRYPVESTLRPCNGISITTTTNNRRQQLQVEWRRRRKKKRSIALDIGWKNWSIWYWANIFISCSHDNELCNNFRFLFLFSRSVPSAGGFWLKYFNIFMFIIFLSVLFNLHYPLFGHIVRFVIDALCRCENATYARVKDI